MKQTYLPKTTLSRIFLRGLSLFVIVCVAGLAPKQSKGQIVISTPYPAPAQSLTLNADTSRLTVEVLFSGACNSNIATVSFPAGVTYVAGSITKISGTSGITIADLGGTASAPTFSINGVTSGGGITFTLKRIAGCSAGSTGKDSVTVIGSCGTAVEKNPGVNSYSIYSPSLTITPPAAITNALVGNSYTRNFSITNGGNGCLDTLRFYLVYPAGDIQLQGLVTGATSLVPFRTNGDTAFYKVSGTNLSSNGLLCNGQTISFTESIRIIRCNNTTTTYGAGWGRTASSVCNWVNTTSAVTIASGVPVISAVFTRTQQLNWCQKGIFTIAYTNTASTGGIAAAAYNFLATIGYNQTGNATVPNGINAQILGRIDSIKIGTVTVPLVAATSSAPAQVNFSGITTDPDGAGIGVDDIDGDGQFDDLGAGKTVTITVYEHWIDNSANCPVTTYRFFTSHTASYTTMCGTPYTTNPLSASGSYSIQSTAGNIVVPAEISGGQAFNIQLCMNLASMFEPVYKPKDSLYLNITLPPGLSLSGTGNIKYNGSAVPASGYYTDVVGGVTTLHIARKGKTNAFCFSADFVYDCIFGGGAISPSFNLFYIGDSCSASRENYLCATRAIQVRCPTPCPDGIVNYQPVATRVNLGYTNYTMTTKVTPAAVTGTAKYSALPLDTIQLIVPGKQFAVLGSYNNLYYNLQFARAASTDVFRFLSGTFNQVSGITSSSSVIAAPATTGSTTAIQKLVWNLSSNLNGGIISNGDSAWLDLRFVVTRANNDLLYGATLQQVASTGSTLYNINSANVKVGCDTAHLINLLVSGNNVSNYTPAVTVSNCSAVSTSSNLYLGNSTGQDIFPVEYRPQSIIDSVVISLPSGYVISPFTNTMNAGYWSSAAVFSYLGTTSTGVVVDRGSNNWVIQNPNLASGGWRLADLGNSASSSYPMGYYISPTCAAVAGTQSYTARWYYRDFVYTDNPASYVNKTLTVSAAIINNTTVKPALTIQNNSGTVSGVLPQHYWDVQINSTGVGVAPYVWMALDGTGSGISVDSVVYAGSAVSGTAYAANKIWYRLTAAGIASGSNIVARVYFKYSSCSADSILVSTGWNCPGYPSNPDLYACAASTRYLSVVPQASQVQIAVSRQPGNGSSITLCTTDSVTAIINSAQSANLINPTITVYPPTGITVSNPMQVEYPLGSGIWQNITATTVAGGGYNINLNSLPGFSANGMPGIYVNPAAAQRQAKLKVSYTSDCSLISGSQFDFYAYGNTPCGTTAIGNGTNAKSNSINISGAATLSHFNTVNFSSSSFGCGNTSSAGAITMSGTITNNGPAVSDNNESIILTLPANYKYVAGSIAAASFPNETIVNNPDGSQRITWKYPAGVAGGSSFAFNPRVYLDTTNMSSCAGLPNAARLQTVVSGTISCGAINCSSFTTQSGVANLTMVVNLPDISPVITSSIASNTTATTWSWTISGRLSNGGAAVASGTSTTVEFFCDANHNGIYDNADYLVGRFTSTSAIPSGGYIPFTFSQSFNSASCNPSNANTAFFAVLRRNPVAAPAQCVCTAERAGSFFTLLPITVQSFTAKQQSQTVLLSWATSSEINSDYIEVERSADGANFSAIGRVEARTYSNTIQYYSLLDKNPLSGKNYYRLKLVDKDGRTMYSTVQVVKIGATVSVNIYPNPVAEGNLTIQLPAGVSRTVQIYDGIGKLLTNIVALPNSTLLINTSGWAHGLYNVVILENNIKVQTEKVIKK